VAGLPGVQVKCVVSGTMADGVQDMSFGFWLHVSDADFITQATLNDITSDVETAVAAFLGTSSVAKFYTAIDEFTKVTCYSYNDGSVSADLVSELLFGSPLAGSGTANHPKETCLVVSLRSLTPGRSGRGRFYLPATGIAMDATGQTSSSTDIDNLASAAKTMFDALIANDYEPVVASFTKSAAYPVATIVVDNRPDTQRRRTDKILPTHTKSLAI